MGLALERWDSSSSVFVGTVRKGSKENRIKGLISVTIECTLCKNRGKRVELGACEERRLAQSVRTSLEVHRKEMKEFLNKDKDQILKFGSLSVYDFVVSLVSTKHQEWTKKIPRG